MPGHVEKTALPTSRPRSGEVCVGLLVVLLSAGAMARAADAARASDDGSRITEGHPIRVGVVHIPAHKPATERIKRIGCEYVALPMDMTDVQLAGLDVVVLPTQFGEHEQLAGRADLLKRYVKQGGGLLVCQPNIDGKMPILPYPITFINTYTRGDKPMAQQSDHPLVKGLTPAQLTFPADRVKDADPRYEVLVIGSISKSPSLLVTEYGAGRIVIQTAAENDRSNTPFADALLVRMIEWLADQRIEPSEASRRAAEALLDAPEKLAAGVAALIEDLDRTDAKKHQRAMQVLVALGDKALAGAERLLAQEPWTDEQLAAVAELAEQLGDSRFQVRQHATERLIAMGRIAAYTVEQVADMTDAEVWMRVELIRQQASHHPASSPTLCRQLAMVRVLEAIRTRRAAALLQATAEDGSSPTLEQHAAAFLAALERRRREAEQNDDQ